jgi:hypothetical protein
MTPAFARTFEEFVDWMALNAPRASVLDWWCRLDQALHEYAAAFRMPEPSRCRTRFEELVGSSDRLGPERARSVRQLRRLRNRVAHGGIYLSPEEARVFANEALALIGVIGRQLAFPGAGSQAHKAWGADRSR